MYETSAETVEDQGFLDILEEMLSDSNSTVVANAVASLTEISQTSGKNYLGILLKTIFRWHLARLLFLKHRLGYTDFRRSVDVFFSGLNEETVSKMLTALGECSEWGQVFVLDALSSYNPPNATVAASVLERITARLSHANAAVVLSTVRLILRMLDLVDDLQLVRTTHKKLGPPLGMCSYELRSSILTSETNCR